jgi:ribosomal protein S18 acetylase RimI-like enzyme
VPPESEGGRPKVEGATAEDAPALARLAAAALPEAWSERGFAEEIGAAAARVWVARGPVGELIGYLVAHAVQGEVQLLSLAVDAAYRRRGIGRILVEHALGQERGAAIAHLEVRSNDAGAQAFYARLRFQPVGRRPGFYPGGVDAISLARVL